LMRSSIGVTPIPGPSGTLIVPLFVISTGGSIKSSAKYLRLAEISLVSLKWKTNYKTGYKIFIKVREMLKEKFAKQLIETAKEYGVEMSSDKKV